MRFKSGMFATGSILVFAVLIATLYYGSKTSAERGDKSLRLFCAAGVRIPIQKVIADYEAEYDVSIETSYDGSGRLLSEIRAVDGGDLYVAADITYVNDARKLDLVSEVGAIAAQRPCVVVRADSQLNVASIDDLLSGNVRMSLADPKAAAVSRVTRKMLAGIQRDRVDVWELLFNNATVTRHTVNEVANDVKTGAVDAGIVWDATANQYDELEIASGIEFTGDANQIVVSILNSAEHAPSALHFMRYLTSRDRGLKVFEEQGYEIVAGDEWADVPEISLFTGGLMHPAIQKTINDFEKREGVRILQTPNGCGILVSQIKAGMHPDAYFACDTTFMTSVQEVFPQWHDVSATEMVIAVNRDKHAELNVQSLEDLANKPLKLGLCDPEHSALGDLTMRLLKRDQLWEKIKPKVLNWPSTADRLVEGVVISGLDAAIVYRANTTRDSDRLHVISIDSPEARAVQPIAVATDSKFPNLTERLITQLRSIESRQRFKDLGFEWLGDR